VALIDAHSRNARLKAKRAAQGILFAIALPVRDKAIGKYSALYG
jgi:hypothetical protein